MTIVELVRLLAPLITVAIGGGWLFHILNIRTQSKKRKETQAFLAIYLAVLFEGYAIDCAHSAGDHDSYEESHGGYGTRIRKVPTFPEFEHRDIFTLLGRDLIDRVMRFPQDRMVSQRNAESYGDVSSHEAYIETAREETVKLGLNALNLSSDLRARYGLKLRWEPNSDEFVPSFLKRESGLIREREVQYAIRHAAFMAELQGTTVDDTVTKVQKIWPYRLLKKFWHISTIPSNQL